VGLDHRPLSSGNLAAMTLFRDSWSGGALGAMAGDKTQLGVPLNPSMSGGTVGDRLLSDVVYRLHELQRAIRRVAYLLIWPPVGNVRVSQTL
jgi:hypothetical protein